MFHTELKIGGLKLYLADGGGAPDFSSIHRVAERSDEAQAHQGFDQLAPGGEVLREFETMSFGPSIAGARDQFGIKRNIAIC